MSRPPRRQAPPTHRLARGRLAGLAASMLAVALSLGPLLAGCSAGQLTQTDTQVSGVDGASGRAGAIEVLDAVFANPSTFTSTYPVGRQAPLRASIVNDGNTPDRLVSASSPVATSVVISGRTTIPGRSLVTVEPPSSGPPPGESGPAGAGPGPGGSPPAAAPGTSPSVTPGTLSVGTVQIVLTGLTQPISPGLTYPVTLVFANAGAVTLPVPVGDPEPEPSGA